MILKIGSKKGLFFGMLTSDGNGRE